MSKRIFRFLALSTVILAGLCSCSSIKYVSAQEDIESVWVGKTYADIVQINGAPERESSDGANGIILIYENVRSYAETSGYMYPNHPWYGYYNSWNTYTTEIRNEVDYVHFFVNEENVCYKVMTNLQKEDGRVPNTGATVAAIAGGAVAAGIITWMIVR